MADIAAELATARAQLAAWLDASRKAAQGQAVSLAGPLGNNSLTRAPASDILDQIKYWKAEVERLELLERAGATTTRVGIGCQRIILHG